MFDLSHRKATRKLHFVNAAGESLPGLKVHARLQTHEFLFGSGAFDFLPALSMEDMGSIDFYQEEIRRDPAFYLDRTQKWLQLFNYGTIPFYWKGYEPEEGHDLFDSRMRTARFLQARGVRVKGHPLCWHTSCADWLMAYDNASILDRQLERIHREVSRFRGLIDMWDVINEVCIMPVYDRYDNAITRICKDLGRIRLCKEVFQAAKEANPDAVLLINDFNTSESYRILIDGLLNAGVPISAIGIQSHQHQGYMGPKKLEDILERFSVFGLPLHFTENTLVSGEIMPDSITDLNDYQVASWPSTPEGEERQRREWRQMYEILFAHPLVEAVTGWDFADGGWLHAPSGIVREDNCPKPAYHELYHLIREEWSTDLCLRTDEKGQIDLTGFKGLYALTAKGHTAYCRLSAKDSGLCRIQLC